jgi:hypothetical protein
LWTPQNIYPQIPAFAALCSAPTWLDWTALSTLIFGLGLLVANRSPRYRSGGCGCVLLSLAMLICLDQHRLQAWAYQLLLFVTFWLLCESPTSLKWITRLIISVYCYSAIGKLDYEFLHTVGQQMTQAGSKWFFRDPATSPTSFSPWIVALIPIAELAIAAGLAWPRSRRVAGVFAIFMHLVLLMILGPLGLNHQAGVLIWNIQFLGQAVFLFQWIPAAKLATVVSHGNENAWYRTVGNCSVASIAILVMVLPCTERFGLWDHWPSWALYAPHSSRVRVEIASTRVEQLPKEFASLISPLDNTEASIAQWVAVPLDSWSLHTLKTPIYPQSRFQLGVARHLAQWVDAELEMRIIVLGPANRFTGQRSTVVLEGNSDIDKAGRAYWFNTVPRRTNDDTQRL